MARSSLAAQLDNILTTVHDLSSQAEEWNSRPAWLEFAPSNVCNLRCVMCAQSDGLPLEVMERDRAIEVLDQILPSASLLTPSALSEPMLANMRLMVEKCREHDTYLNFHTNATVLDGEKLRDIGDRVHQLFISFDSPVKETFEELRAPANFERVRDNIVSILPVAHELNIPVTFVSVFMRQNADQIAELVDFLAELGAAATNCSLRVQPMLDNSTRTAGMLPEDAYTEEELTGFVDAACDRARVQRLNLYVEVDGPLYREITDFPSKLRGVIPDVLMESTQHTRENFPGFCAMASYYMKIEPNGKVFPCCRGPEELVMGNVLEQSVEEIWNGDRYREFRRRMFSGDYPDVCKGCDVLTANPGFKKLQEQKAQRPEPRPTQMPAAQRVTPETDEPETRLRRTGS